MDSSDRGFITGTQSLRGVSSMETKNVHFGQSANLHTVNTPLMFHVSELRVARGHIADIDRLRPSMHQSIS